MHRDLKPENVVRTAAGVVKVLDFGLARMESQTPLHLTEDGVAFGTVRPLRLDARIGGGSRATAGGDFGGGWS